MTPLVHLQSLGLTDYNEAVDYQEQLFKSTNDEKIRIRNAEVDLKTKN